MSCKSPECKSLLHCRSGLTDCLKQNLSVSDKLLEKELVTEAVHEWILTAQGVSNRDKASRVASCVTDSIHVCSDKFNVLIEVLREVSDFDDIVRRMLDEHGKILLLY